MPRPIIIINILSLIANAPITPSKLNDASKVSRYKNPASPVLAALSFALDSSPPSHSDKIPRLICVKIAAKYAIAQLICPTKYTIKTPSKIATNTLAFFALLSASITLLLSISGIQRTLRPAKKNSKATISKNAPPKV